ncbi:MAG: cell envelope integrity EipB family protein [Rhodospirillales bacterium]|nr:DUF1849 family protein [Rhodospirillales bacterium]MDE2198196.1 cell envelope integrity EipB family protein [Rhodospirillales bacterium]MDE2573964.1 cell envelope integrity EipB family protein [Rhodospirillales bacterium]
MRRLAALALFVLLVAAWPGPPGRAAPPVPTHDLAAHHALYTLSLDSARGDVIAASGTMAYEVIDACDGWATRQLLAMTLTNRDGQDVRMRSDYSTWESKDGLHLRFHMRQTTDQDVTSDIAGSASLTRPGGPGEVRYTLPKPRTAALPPGTLFPMTHTAAILAGAQAGKKFLAIPLFDGTADNGAQDSAVTVTAVNPPMPGKWPALAGLPSDRVHIAFFDRAPATMEPDYEVGMRYWANGVADDLRMNFGDFVMTGALTELKMAKPGC